MPAVLSKKGALIGGGPNGIMLSPDSIGLAGGDINLYRYCWNNPVNFVDPWGLDIWVEGSSGPEPFLHQSISVGDPEGEYNSYSFGLDSRWKVFIPTPWREGEVYKDPIGGGKIVDRLKTTPEQDKKAKQILDSLVGEKDKYGITYGNCRQFSRQMFDFFKEEFDSKDNKEKDCK